LGNGRLGQRAAVVHVKGQRGFKRIHRTHQHFVGVLALRDCLGHIRKSHDKTALRLRLKNDRIIEHGLFLLQAELFLEAFHRPGLQGGMHGQYRLAAVQKYFEVRTFSVLESSALFGQGGADILGGDASGQLFGGDGADYMEGRRGLDVISGGADDVALRQGHAGDKSGAAFASGVRRGIQTMQHPARQRDVHPLHLVIQHGRVDTHHRPNPILELRVTRAQRIDRRRLRNRLASIKHGLNPADYRLFGIDHRLIQSISGGKTAGQIGYDHTEGMRLVAVLNSNRVMHGNLLKTRLLADGFHDTASQILLRVRHYHDAGARRMHENVMGTLHPVEYPTGLFDLPDQVRAVHGVYDTHSNLRVQAFRGGNDTLYAQGEASVDAALAYGATQTASNLKGDWLDDGAGNKRYVQQAMKRLRSATHRHGSRARQRFPRYYRTHRLHPLGIGLG
jgi:hypothetical protein